jgi:hypothetical protein
LKICLFLEGSYPHVTGGVSTWAQMLIKNMPEFEFIIYSIGAEEKYKGIYKYKLPDNVTAVREVFLDEMLKEKGVYGKRYKLSKDEINNLKSLITGEKVEWSHIFKLMAEKRIKNALDFFMSYNFFDILRDGYMEKFGSVPFTEFLKLIYTTAQRMGMRACLPRWQSLFIKNPCCLQNTGSTQGKEKKKS